MLGLMAIGNLFLLISIVLGLCVEVYRVYMTQNQIKIQFKPPLAINAVPFHTVTSLVFEIATPVSVMLVLLNFLMFAFSELFAHNYHKYSILLHTECMI